MTHWLRDKSKLPPNTKEWIICSLLKNSRTFLSFEDLLEEFEEIKKDIEKIKKEGKMWVVLPHLSEEVKIYPEFMQIRFVTLDEQPNVGYGYRIATDPEFPNGMWAVTIYRDLTYWEK